jgi:hypothetical protein
MHFNDITNGNCREVKITLLKQEIAIVETEQLTFRGMKLIYITPKNTTASVV